MTRRALLIGSPNGPDPQLPGVDIDLRDIQAFLLSARGGAWYTHEITVLRNPSKAAVSSELERSKNIDYVFVTCSGHGEHHVYNNFDDTVLCLNKTEEMYISEINPRNKRHLVVVDACRKVVKIALMEQRLVAAKAYEFFESAEDRARARTLFDNAVVSSTEGRIVVYSCEKNQSAGDDGKGGVFTQSLLIAGKEMRKKPTGVVDINEAFAYAKDITYKLNAPQTPTINAGRRRDYFPFSVTT